jgi:glutamate racemase
MGGSDPIGIFDSGVGGLTVVRSLAERLPSEALIYLGDTARVPYGSKSAETVVRYSKMSARFLLDQGVKMILVACNTASAYALDVLAAELPVPVLGAVLPGAKAAISATRSGAIGVIGTLGTVRSLAYRRAIDLLQPTAPPMRITARACPLLVPLVEEGWLEDPISEAIARRYLGELRAEAPDLDVLVLGCTHYPLLRPLLQRVGRELFGHDVELVDSSQVMAEEAEAELSRLGLRREGAPGGLKCYVTDDARIGEVGARFLGRPLGSVERVDLSASR